MKSEIIVIALQLRVSTMRVWHSRRTHKYIIYVPLNTGSVYLFTNVNFISNSVIKKQLFLPGNITKLDTNVPKLVPRMVLEQRQGDSSSPKSDVGAVNFPG